MFFLSCNILGGLFYSFGYFEFEVHVALVPRWILDLRISMWDRGLMISVAFDYWILDLRISM